MSVLLEVLLFFSKMNANSKHVNDSDTEAKCRENKLDMMRKFKQFATRDEESVSSSYLSLSGHDSGGTRQSSMSYVSVNGTGTLSEISSGFLYVAENHDWEYDDSGNIGNKCFLCSRNGIEAKATHMCQTCRPEKKFMCHKCLQLHITFCEEHDVLSLSVKCEQQTEPYSHTSDILNVEQNFTYNSYDQGVPLEETSIHLRKTESGKKTLYKPANMDHKNDSEYQQTILSKKPAILATDCPDIFKHAKMPTCAKFVGFPTDSVSLRRLDKPSQTDFSDMKHSLVQMGANKLLVGLIPTDSVQLPASNKARNDYHQTKRSNFTCELENKKLQKPKIQFAVRNKNERNQCHFQEEAEQEEEYRDRALEVGQKVTNVIINSTSDARKLKRYELVSRQANSNRQSSLHTSSEAETNVVNINTFADERVSNSGLNLNYIDKNLLEIENSSNSFHDASQNKGSSVLNINSFVDERVCNAYGNTDVACGIEISGTHIVTQKRTEWRIRQKELQKRLYDDKEPCLKTLEFTSWMHQLQSEEDSRTSQKIKSKDLTECSEILVALKSGNKIKILQSVSEHKRDELHIQEVRELKKTLLYDDEERCLLEAFEFTRVKQRLLQEDVARTFQKTKSKDLIESTDILEAFKAGDEIKILQSVSERCKTKPNYRLAVVPPEVFEEALRKCQIFEYDLTYSNDFPRDCKMIIGIPVYKEGFLNRFDKGGFINRRHNKNIDE